MSIKPIGVGLIGSGAISYTYLDNMVHRFDILNVIGCSDIIEERSKSRAEEFGIKQMTNEEIFADPDIQIVVNTTYPKSHYAVTKAALEAGKHVQSEKMMAVTFEEAKELYDLAKSKNLRFGCAPDTFLGAGYQTCRKLIDDGYVGTPLAVNATIIRGYQPAFPVAMDPMPFIVGEGGTIPFDMGGYYIQAMQNLFGAVKRVSGFSQSREKIFSHPKNPQYKEVLKLNSPNFIQAALEFDCGVLGTLTACDSGFVTPEIPGMTVYGTDGVLICPDPNYYAGPVKLIRNGGKECVTMPLTHGYSGEEVERGVDLSKLDAFRLNWQKSRRGIGVADMAWAITNNRPQRCSAEMALHTIEIIHGVKTASETGKYYEMTTHPEKPKALRPGFIGGAAEAVLDD